MDIMNYLKLYVDNEDARSSASSNYQLPKTLLLLYFLAELTQQVAFNYWPFFLKY